MITVLIKIMTDIMKVQMTVLKKGSDGNGSCIREVSQKQ